MPKKITVEMPESPPEVEAKLIFDTTIMFVWRKETPGTHSYQQVDEAGNEERTPVGTIYIKKDAMKGGVPKVLHVRIRGM